MPETKAVMRTRLLTLCYVIGMTVEETENYIATGKLPARLVK